MTSRIPEPSSSFEDEGVPDMGYTLDQKEVTGDAQEGMEPPRDTAIAVDEYGTTAAEMAEGEPHDLRISREEPDVLAEVDSDPDYSDSAADPYSEGAGQDVGRIVETDEGARADHEPDVIAYDAGTDGGGFSAEEAAMHLEPEV